MCQSSSLFNLAALPMMIMCAMCPAAAVCRGARPGQNRFRCLLACTWQRAAQQPSYGHSGQQQRSGSAPPCQGHPSCEPRPPDTRQPHPLQGRGRQGQGGTSEGGWGHVWCGGRRWRPAHLDLPSLESETLSGVAQQRSVARCGQCDHITPAQGTWPQVVTPTLKLRSGMRMR